MMMMCEYNDDQNEQRKIEKEYIILVRNIRFVDDMMIKFWMRERFNVRNDGKISNYRNPCGH